MTLGGLSSNSELSRVVDYGISQGRRFQIIRARFYWQGGGPPVDLVPAPRGPSGMQLTSASARFDIGVADYVWKYEAVDPDSWATYQPTGDVSMYEGSLNKSPITMHKDFGKWIGYRNPITGAKYGRVSGGEVIWEAEDPNQASGRRGLSKDGAKISNLNPLYGVNDFYDVAATFIIEEPMNKGQLSTLFNNVGKIGNPPGARSAAKGGDSTRNWLYVGASAQQVGTSFIVRKTWMLSGPGGWEPAIYEY